MLEAPSGPPYPDASAARHLGEVRYLEKPRFSNGIEVTSQLGDGLFDTHAIGRRRP
jgi:hypothetical protein